MVWARLLAYATGAINRELLLKNEYLVAENRILKTKVKGRLVLFEAEKATLAEIAHRLGRKALEEVAATAQPGERESLANLGHRISDQTVGNIRKRHGISPTRTRRQTVRWKDFIRSHMAVLAGADFFTVEILTLKGLVTYHVLFFIQLESRRICVAGMTSCPDADWMDQQARNVTLEDWGFLKGCRYLLHDRDAKFSLSFRQTMKSGNVNPLRLPARSPNLNSYAERWVRSVKEECLSRILFGESSLRRALEQYIVHYHEERNHQGKDNRILFPSQTEARRNRGAVRCRQRLGGLLKYYKGEAA